MGLLSELATKHGTDKWNHHYYTEHYEYILGRLQHSPINLLEIGVGGYQFVDRGGESLRMWREFFPNATIYSIDIHNKRHIKDYDQFRIYTGSQTDPEVLNRMVTDSGGFDVVIDDGSHHSADQIASFEFLFPRLKPRGIYVVEDAHSSYWPEMGGKKVDFGRWDDGKALSAIEYFFGRIHMMHHIVNGLTKDDLCDSIESVQFFNSLIFIQKGYNA